MNHAPIGNAGHRSASLTPLVCWPTSAAGQPQIGTRKPGVYLRLIGTAKRSDRPCQRPSPPVEIWDIGKQGAG
jgi:hypothetical protein